MFLLLFLILGTCYLSAYEYPKYSSDYVLSNVYNSTSRVINVAGTINIDTTTISNVNVINDTISVRQIEPIKSEQYGDWIIKKATVVIENQIDQPLEDGGNVNVTNFPGDYPLPSSQVNDLKVVVDTTTHSELNTLNNKDFATETTLNSIDTKIIKCNTDSIAGTVYATPNGTYTIKQSGLWQIDKGTITIDNFPSEYPLPSSQVSDLKSVTITNSTITVKQVEDVNVTATDLDIRDLTDVSDSVQASQKGTWNVNSIQNGSWSVDANVTNSTIVVRQADTVNVVGTVNAVQSGSWNVNASQSGTWTVDTTGSTNTVIATDLDVRDLNYTSDSITSHQGGTWNVNAVQSGDWSIKKATVVVENQIAQPLQDGGNVNVSNFPSTYALPSSQIDDLKIVIDTTTHNKLDTLNGKDFATETTLGVINGKVTICNTDNVKASSTTFNATVYQIDKARSITNFPSEYPLPSSQISDLKIVVDTTTHNELNNLNSKIIKCDTDNIKSSSDTFKATIYQANVLDTNITNSIITIRDERYGVKVTTMTSGITTSDLTINITNEMIGFDFLSYGGSAEVTMTNLAGKIVLADGQSFSRNLKKSINNPTIKINVLGSGTTVFYFIERLK